MSLNGNNVIGSSGYRTNQPPFEIDQSLRMGRTSKLEFTPSGDGNKQVATLSFWLKNCGVSDSGSTDNTRIFTAGNSTSDIIYYQIMHTNPTLQINAYRSGPGNGYWNHDPYYRDYSAWQHFVIAYNQGAITTYVNGEVVADTYTTSGTGWVGSVDTAFNSNGVLMKIGPDSGSASVKDIYLAEVHWVDGQNLSASSFGETDSATNQWVPIEVTGMTYGTNGFYLPFSSTELANSFTDSVKYTVESFTSTGTTSWTAPTGVTSVEYLVVAGGGGGGGGYYGGGGGAGGMLTGTHSVTPGNSYTVTVGAGGAGTSSSNTNGSNGSNSVFDSITANGGGGGGAYLQTTPTGGGSGGGGGRGGNGAAGTVGQGNAGGNGNGSASSGGGGGGGAGAAGGAGSGSGGSGGDGLQSNITGTNTYYAGGGGGGSYNQNNFNNGGQGGGGTGNFDNPAGSGTANTGGGGGGASVGGNPSGAGGSGIVIVRYLSTSGTVSRHTITANGDVANTRAQKKIGSSSIKFDGTGDYLSLADSADWNIFGSGNWTTETWVKLDNHSQAEHLFGQYEDGSNKWEISHNGAGSNNGLQFGLKSGGSWVISSSYASSGSGEITDTDWHHVALVKNSNTYTLYLDGTALDNTVTDTDTDDISGPLSIGQNGANGSYLTGYMDEIRISDTARYTSSFTPSTTAFTADANTLLLIHSDFNGGLGADSSGNTNDFSATNLVATDQVLDSPTNNFATLNPLDPSSNQTLSEGNLKQVTSGQGISKGTMQIPSSGKWYWEVCQTDTDQLVIGFAKPTATLSNYLGSDANGWGYGGYSGVIYNNGGSSAYGNTYTNGDIVGVAFDADNQAVYFSKNNTWQNSGDPTSGSSKTGAAVTSLTDEYSPASGSQNSSGVYNFGQDSSFAGNKTAQGNQDGNGIGDFYYTPPSGFVALCSDNLPDPSIADPTKHFNTVTYSGNDTSQSISGVGFSPELLWLKLRTANNSVGNQSHSLQDIVRGAQKQLVSNATYSEWSETDYVTSFDSDGFSVGSSTAVNDSGNNYVAWNWKAGGTAVSNTDGTITSSVSANTDAGFSIVSYTGITSSGTVGHGLSQAPELVIVKPRSYADNWRVGSDELTSWVYHMRLNDTAAETSYAAIWNSTAPTSTVFSSGTDGTGGRVDDYIAYCFHGVEGYSKVGSYTGNGSSDGTFIYTGFKPSFLLVRSTAGSRQWFMHDNKRDPYNYVRKKVYANLSNAEPADTVQLDFVSNGFKARVNDANWNGSGETYIYLAFAESPFKTSNAR